MRRPARSGCWLIRKNSPSRGNMLHWNSASLRLMGNMLLMVWRRRGLSKRCCTFSIRRRGKDLAETIDRMEADYTDPTWLADSSGFVYSRRSRIAGGCARDGDL